MHRWTLLVIAFVLVVSGRQVPAQSACARLIFAVSTSDIAEALQAIRSGCSPDTALDGGGATALMWAGSVEMVRALLHAGATADHRNEEGINALDAAAFRSDVDSLRALLSAGARANAQGRSLCGPLCSAAASESASPSIVRILLDAGASVNTSDCWNRNAMFIAGIAGKTEVLAVLLEGNPDVNTFETYGGDPLIVHVAQGGSARALEMLVRGGAKIDWPNARSCGTALHAAARRGYLSAVQRLLELGADVKATDSAGKTARGVAMDNGHSAVATYLQSQNAPPSGSIRTDCISVADLPDAAQAWQRARQRTRGASCASVVGPTLN